MSRFKNFIVATLIGGIAVVLPATLLAFLFKWLYKVIIGIIRPLTMLVFAKSNIQVIFADIIVVAIILLACFAVGMVVKTRLGVFIQESLDDYILKFVPGYSIIKETILQFMGKKKFPFSLVVRVIRRILEALTASFPNIS